MTIFEGANPAIIGSYLVAGVFALLAARVWGRDRRLSATLLVVALSLIVVGAAGTSSNRHDEMGGIPAAVLAGTVFWFVTIPAVGFAAWLRLARRK